MIKPVYRAMPGYYRATPICLNARPMAAFPGSGKPYSPGGRIALTLLPATILAIVTDRPLVISASGSPRRRELLRQLGLRHEMLAVDINESRHATESPRDCVERLARAKAGAAFARSPRSTVIGADTMVIAGGKMLGKPRGHAGALKMLKCLSGRLHEVLTAVAVIGPGGELSCVQRSKVVFRRLSFDEMVACWRTGEPEGKAGGYAIQGRAAQFIERIEGSYSGVMGLPLYETAQLLKESGINLL